MAILSLKPKEKEKKDIEFKRLDPDILAQRDIGIAQQKLQQRISEIPDRPIQTFLLNAVDSALLSPKVTDVLTLGALKQTREDMALKNPTSALLGNIAGYIVPGSIATKGTTGLLKGAAILGLKAGVRGAKTVGQTTKAVSKAMQANKALNYAVTEGIAGTGIGLAQGIIEGESGKDIAKRVALEAGIGAAGGALFGKIATPKPKKVNDAELIESVKNNYFKGAKLNQLEQPKGKLKQFKQLREAKVETPKAVTNIAEEIDATKSLFDEQIEAVTGRFEDKISRVKQDMPKGNARKRQINKFNKQKQREIAKIKDEQSKAVGELEKQLPQTATEPTKPTTIKAELDTKISKIKADFEAKREAVKRQFSAEDVKSKQIKALGMEESAEIRKAIQGDKLVSVEGGLTPKELKSKVDKLKSNYIGKDVLVDGKQGKIEKNVFGDVMVKLNDGTTVKVPKDKIKPVQDVDALIKEQMKQPKPVPKTKIKEIPKTDFEKNVDTLNRKELRTLQKELYEELKSVSVSDSNLDDLIKMKKYVDKNVKKGKVSTKRTAQQIDDMDFSTKTSNSKSIQETNPELEPYIQNEARELISDINNAVKGERTPIFDEDGYITGYSGTKREASETLIYVLDQLGMDYNQARVAAEKIIKGTGLEDNAASKKLSVLFDKNLTEGKINFRGDKISPNRDYLDLKGSYTKKTLKRIKPKTMKVKGITFEPTFSENSSVSAISKVVDDKPSYKGKERESRFRQKTMYEADVTGKDIKKSIEENKTTYRSVDNQKDWEFAKSKVDKDFDAELKKFRDTGKRTGSVDTMRGEALFVNALQKGDTKLADEISSELSLRLTEAGQEIQAASFFKKLSPEGMIMYQQKLINKVNAGLEETAEQAFKKIKPKRGVAQGVFKVSDLVDDASWLKGFLADMNKQCKL